jgi:alanyl-tRNA synthetase
VPIGNPKEILQIAKQVQGTSGATAVLAGADPETGKAGMVALLTSDDASKASARDLIAAAAPKIGGGGGGSDEMAQAGGKNPEGVAEALAAAREYLESL